MIITLFKPNNALALGRLSCSNVRCKTADSEFNDLNICWHIMPFHHLYYPELLQVATYQTL